MFPSIGPYQCEICQNITQTKKEFVEHIKAKHRKIVDEEVLRSLEKDLQKSLRKAEKERKEKRGSPAIKKKAPAKGNTPAGNWSKRVSRRGKEFLVVRNDCANCAICWFSYRT